MNGDLVHEVGFGKGGGFTGESADSLAQGAIESLNVVGWPISGRLLKLLTGHDPRIGFPDVSKAAPDFVSLGNPAPENAAGFHAPAPDGKSYNLPGAPTQSQPQPAFVFPFEHECPCFIEFQLIAFFKGKERLVQGGQAQPLFLSHLVTVWRETPKMRVKPRKLLRS